MRTQHGTQIPWFALAGLTALGLGWCGALLVQTYAFPLPACPVKTITGIPCATCGISRCIMALAHGKVGEAFHWHPVATILLFSLPLLMLWDLWRANGAKPYPELPDSMAARLAVAGLFAATWLLQIVRGI